MILQPTITKSPQMQMPGTTSPISLIMALTLLKPPSLAGPPKRPLYQLKIRIKDDLQAQ